MADRASDSLRPVALESRDPAVAAAIHEVWTASYLVEAARLGVPSFPPLARTEEEIERAATSFSGILVEGRLAAALEVDLPTPDTAAIEALVVHPDHFRKGLGSRLVAHTLERYRDRTVSVSTAVANEPAIALYRALGFIESERWTAAAGIPMLTLVSS